MKRIGTRLPVGDDELQSLRVACRRQLDDAGALTAHRTAVWNNYLGRTRNGLLSGLQTACHGELPKPFKGAADNRIRWSEKIVNSEVSLILSALSRAKPRVVAVGDVKNGKRGRALTVLLEWCLQRMGRVWVDELERMLRYTMIDVPACAGFSVGWSSRRVVAPRVITREQVLTILIGAYPSLDPSELWSDVEGGAIDDAMVAAVAGGLGVQGDRARKILEALAQEVSVEVSMVVDVDERPVVSALRFYDDFTVPKRCERLEMESPWFRSEWMTASELICCGRNEGWDERWVDETLEHTGEELFSFGGSNFDGDDLRGRYQVIRAYLIDVDGDGNLVRYEVIFSAAEGTASGRVMLSGNGGSWPMMLFTREKNSSLALDSRGVAEIATPSQEIAKKLRDVGSNNGMLGGLPPLIGKNIRTQVTLKPLALIKLPNVNSELKYLQPPAYPAQLNNDVDRLRDEMLDYFGLFTKEGDQDLLGIVRRERVNRWMINLRDVLVSILSTAQAHASEELVRSVLGQRGMVDAVREDIEGSFSLSLSVNSDDMLIQNVTSKAQALGQVLGQLDPGRKINPTPIAEGVVRSLYPDLSEDTFEDAGNLSEDDVRDEELNITKIKAGLRPKMDTQGRWNFEVRLGVWQSLMESSPSFFEGLDEASQAFAQEWMGALRQQAQQYGANAALGRTGSAEVQAMEDA